MITELFEILTEIINQLGYLGIFVTTGLEYACFPVSSELLLPFIGYTISKGEMNLAVAILISTLGGIIGCLFCYMIGRFGGEFIEKTICKKSKTASLGIEHAKQYFLKHGNQSVMLGRVLPIVRTYISVPAGMAKMDLFHFLVYTGLGALAWNTVLISLGYYLGEHWLVAKEMIKSNSIFIIGAVVLILVFVILNKRQKKRRF